MQFAKDHGWTASAATEPPTGVVVTAEHNGMKITARWVDGKVTAETLPVLSRQDRRDVRLRNVSAARKIIEAQA